ncbi:MAG: tetratricopeptide repeat protein [Burkholderiales bacterium]|nr:tetratricopeptide repeat protein [Burkholderiales bacterium]
MKHISRATRARRTSLLAGLGLALLLPAGAWAQKTAAAPAAPASVPTVPVPVPKVENSYLSGPLLRQLLEAELTMREGQSANAIELMLQAARENKDDALYRRALQMAAEAGAGDKALAITRSWHAAMPRSTEALLTEIQLLIRFDRIADTAEPLRQLLQISTPPERVALISSLPRAQQRAKDKGAAAEMFRQLLQPWIDAPDTRVAAHVALGRIRLNQGQPMFALDLADQALASDPKALPPVLLALDVMNSATDGAPARAGARAAAAASAASAPATTDKGTAPSTALIARAEVIVRRYLAQPGAEPVVHQAYASVLATQQRLTDAAEQLRLAVRDNATQAPLWLALGEIDLELHDPVAADADLQKALALVSAEAAEEAAARKSAAAANANATDDDDDAPAPAPSADAAEAGPNPVRLSHIQVLLARAAEQRHDDAAAAKWLAQVDAKDVDLQVISMRATLLARQGKLGEALRMIRAADAGTPAEQRYKLLTEVQLLIDEKRLGEAREILGKANAENPDDVELVYQEAMVDERLNRLDEMEKLLRRILVLQPDNSQALNALGYSLADRNLRLDEALTMVRQAHELSPADPFIVDSLGWVEYRMGHFDAAASLLAQAYSSRKDTEIAAHLAEALWADGKRDEAARVLRDAHRLDAGNEVLKKTMARLKVAP